MCAMVLTVLMMNLLIGILSEKLSELLSQITTRNYTNLLGLVKELEELHFWKRAHWLNKCWTPPPAEYKHLVFASNDEDSQEQNEMQGRAASTDKKIKGLSAKVDGLKLEMTTATKKSEEKMQRMEAAVVQKNQEATKTIEAKMATHQEAVEQKIEENQKANKQQFDTLIQLLNSLDVPKKEIGVDNGLDKEGGDD